MNIGERLKSLRESNNLTRREVVEQLKNYGIDISDKTLYGYESGRNSANADMFLALCRVYKCNNIMEIFSDTVDDVLFTNKEWELIEKYRDLSSYDQETVTQLLDRLHGRKELRNIIEYHAASDPLNRFIPYQHSASAGSGIYILGNEAADQIAIPALPEYDDVDYAVKVNGHSMEPDFCDGEAALISQRKEMEIGDVGIFVKNGEVFIKELGETELISRNPDYPNIPVTENDNVVCLGKVIGKLQA